ncbi:MAG: PorT family protein [Bacteroidetes bacterium]|nr:MAG: PorT family protein [Bacteroidota bacterium]
MKKLTVMMILAIFTFQVADAQVFKLGIKAGIGFCSLKFEDITGINTGTATYDLVTGETVTGYHLGLQGRVKVAMLFIQPELYFNAGGGTVEQVVSGGSNKLLHITYNRIDLPILVGVKAGPLRINAGPAGSWFLSESHELGDLPGMADDYKLFDKKLTWGFQAGLGVDILKRVTLDARYEGSLSKLGETTTIGTRTFALDARPSQWLISVGVFF